MAPTIKQGYTSKSGIYYDKVREIAFEKGQLIGNLGNFVMETRNEMGSSNKFSDDLNGVLIYQSRINPLVGYRIYKDYADCGYYGYSDYKFINQLNEKKDNILLSKFPTGVVTLYGNVIGQEIPYFPDHITLYNFFEKYKNINPVKIYRIILNILKEMYDNGIAYLDIHPGNFLINPNDTKTKIEVIDFEDKYLRFGQDAIKSKDNILYNYSTLIEKLNKLIGIDKDAFKFLTPYNFDNVDYQLDEIEKVLKKKK